MTRFPASGGGSGPPYTYVMDGYPSDAEEGESLYHITEDAAYVYTGSTWVEQTVTNHSQLAGISEGDHRSDQRVAELAPVESVNGRTGAVSGLLDAADYNPEADTHARPSGTGSTGGAKGWINHLNVSGPLNENEQDTYSRTINAVVNGIDYDNSGNLWSGSYVRLRDFDGNVFWSRGTGNGGDAKSGRDTFSMRYVTELEVGFRTEYIDGTNYSGQVDLHERGPVSHQHNI